MLSALIERGSLLRRVVWSSALAAALGGAIAATAGGIATINLVDEHEEEVLAQSTQRLAEEVEEEEAEDDETTAEALEDELGDVDYVGTKGVIRAEGAVLAGDPTLPAQEPDTCHRVMLPVGPYRACTVLHNGREVTLAVNIAHTQSLRPLFALATCVGILVGIGAGVILGRRAARWGLDPLVRLRDQVRRVRPDAPNVDVLEPPAKYVEIEELRSSVSQLVERLGASLSHAQRFAAHASHELRTPLTAIAGEIELLAETASADDAAALVALRARVDSMVRLVQRLLVLSVPHDAQTGEAVDLSDVAADAVASLSPTERARVKLETADDVLVRGDSTLLGTALSNAIDNALKFSTDEISVRVSGSKTDAWIEVSDRGPGIPMTEGDRLFEPFYRSPSARRHGIRGSGIGLALISHVVSGHGGHTEFVDVARGACLRVTLPRWTHPSDTSGPQ